MVIFAMISMAPLFVFAITTQDNGETAGISNVLATQDNGTTTGTGSAPTTQDNGTTAGTSNTPVTQDNGTTAGTGNVPATQDNGTTTGTGSDSSPSGGSGSGKSGTAGGRTSIQISNIKVTLVGFSIPVTNLFIGQTYAISWSASVQNVNTALNLASISSGSKISIGVSANPNTVNTLNWIVPVSAALGNYTLYFTDPNNKITNATDVYKIMATRSASSANLFGGTGGGSLSQTGESSESANESATEDLTAPSGVNEKVTDETQTAAAGNAFVNFLSSKYVFWFFIIFLVIAGILLAWERKNQNSYSAEQQNAKPFISQQQNTQVKTPIKPVNTNTEKINQPSKLL